MYLDWGTMRVKRAANKAQREGGGRQSTRADRYRRAAAAELLLLWEDPRAVAALSAAAAAWRRQLGGGCLAAAAWRWLPKTHLCGEFDHNVKQRVIQVSIQIIIFQIGIL